MERVLGKVHPETLKTKNNLAEVLSNQGKYEEEEEIHRQGLTVSEKILGKEHPDTLTSKNNLASLLNARGKCDIHITILPSAKAVDIGNHLLITLDVQAVQQWKRKPLPTD